MPRHLPLAECNLFFFDCETGGLSAHNSDMVEVGCVLTDPSGNKVLEEYSAKVFPQKDVDPRAAQVNGYTKEKWAAEAIPLDEAMHHLIPMARNALFAAHNAPFDWAFFEKAMALRGMRWQGDYHRIDTVSLAWPLLKNKIVANVKLQPLTEHFHIPHEDAHTALGDVRACRSVYLKLEEIYDKLFASAHLDEQLDVAAVPVAQT
jgi:DNA polymerase-3 subunit epsilon